MLGAIIGGGIGNAVGNNKSSKRVGAAIASDLQKNSYAGRCHEPYCDDDYHHERRVIVGYDVKYRYHGKTCYTHMKHKSGRRIKVIVDVRPAC